MRFGLVKLVVSAIVTEVALKLWLGFDHTAVKLQIGRFLELDVHRDRIELTVRGHCQQHDVTPSGCNTPILINGTLGLGLEDDISMSVVGVDTRSAERFEAEVLLVGDRSQLSSAVLKVSIEDINDGVQCVAVEWLHTVYDSRVTAEQHLNAPVIGNRWSLVRWTRSTGTAMADRPAKVDCSVARDWRLPVAEMASPTWLWQIRTYCRAILGNFDRDRNIGRRRIRFPAKINTTYIPLDPVKH